MDTSAFESDASFTDAVMETPVMVDFVRQAGTQWKVKLQILDGDVDLPAAVEAVVETGRENKEEEEEEEESPVTSANVEQEMTSEENHLREETSVNETTTSERVVQSVAKCPKVSLPKKLKVKTCRRLKSRLTKKRGTKTDRRRTSSSSDKAPIDRTAAFIPPSVRPQQLVFAPIDLDSGYFGFAAAVTTPWEFSVVLEDLLLVMDKVSVLLEELPDQTSPVPDAHVVQGTCCLWKSDSKNKWCRTEIVNTDAAVVLNLVDYGYCECLPLKHCSELRRLPEELMNLPKVTYPCVLRGVKPAADAQWTDEAAVFFQQCLNQKNLQIFFREFESHAHWKVDILADGAHVARELVEAGHADYVDVMLGLRFDSSCTFKT